MSWVYGQEIWDRLMADIGNAYGVAGLMGNLHAESGLIPYRVQGDFSSGYTTSITYTEQVDNGTVSESEFVNREQGYGLAQWTFYSRKQGLYDMKQSMGVSIGSVELGVAYLLYELKNDFNDVYSALTNATSIRNASDIVLHEFEAPADRSTDVEVERASYASEIFNLYSGTTPITPTPTPEKSPKKRGYNFVLFGKRRRMIYDKRRISRPY